MLRRPVARLAAQCRRCASTGTPKDGSHRFTIDDRGHEIWGCRNSQPPKRIVQLRFAHVPESMVDALAAIREVERNFGRIRDYRPLRSEQDADRPSEYQAIFWVAFESPESLKLIPPTGITLKIPVPVREKPEGGPGLNDILDLLDSQDRARLDHTVTSPVQGTKGGKSDGSVRVIDVDVRRTSDHDIRYRNTTRPPIRSKSMKAAIGHAFLDWGGFAPLEPLFETSPFFTPSQAPKTAESNMRLALNKWSQILDRPDPSFPEMQARREADAAKDPQPGHRFVDEVTKAITLDSTRQGIQQSKNPSSNVVKATPSENNWEPLKDFKVNPKRQQPTKATTAPKPDNHKLPKRARLLEKAREQAREKLLRQKGEATESSTSLKESFERTLNRQAVSTSGRDKGTTPESGQKGFWSWF
ncbi:hypothetical protein V8B97DRAFT_2007262 [Scleroderma yunnanense]